MAYYSKNGSGIDAWAYIYVQLQVTRTDYPTYSHFDLKSVAVSDTGTSGFIRGQVTTNQGGTSWTAVTGWKDVYYNSTTTLAISSFNVDRGASDKTVRCGAYAEGGGTGIYAGGTDYAWLNVTVPKVLAPNAPTGCTATYVSDSQASVSWTNGTTDTDHPRDATLVERRDGSNDWAQVASASGTASGYTDNGISPNTQYQYRVRAKNVAGYSAYSTGGSIYTTPAAPSSVTLDKTAATTVQVDVTGTWGYAVTYDIESTYDGGSTWASVATSTSLPYSATVNAGTVQFRVRAVRGALSSAWTNSASLVTICPPLAPTIVQAPANPTAYGDSSVISWTPNHPDGSTQSAAEVKVTNPGGTSTTYSVSTATSYTLTPNATGTWTAQVRTKGLDPSYGEWSQTVSWGVYNPPAVVITSPATDGTDVVSLPMTVSWTVTDSTGVSAQRIIIEGDGQILNRTLAGDVRTVALNASDVALENGQTYTIRLRVMGGSGLVTEQTRIFDVAWLAPTPPVLQITEGEGRSATIDVMDTRYTSSGTIIEASSSMMESLTIHGASVQDGTPSPSSPVPIQSVEGRNLFLNSDDPSQWRGYNTTGYLVAQIPLEENLVVGQKYVLQLWGTTTRSDGNTQRFAAFWGGGYVQLGNLTATTTSRDYWELVFTVPESTHASTGNAWVELYSMNSSSTATITNSIAKAQLVLVVDSSVPSRFYPYCQSDAIGAVCEGKNRFSVNGTRYDYGSYIYAYEPMLKPNTKYTCSTNIPQTSTAAVYLGGGSTATNGVWTGRPVTATTDANGDVFIGVRFNAPSGSVNAYQGLCDGTYWLQLEEGTAATEYEPYSSTTTPIPVTLRSLPDGTHDEWISGESADTYIQRVGRVVLTGAWSGAFIVGSTASSSLKMFLLQMAKFNEIFGASAAPRRTGDAETDRGCVYCDLLPRRTTAYNVWTDIGISGWSDASAAFLFAPGEGLTTSDEFKTWLNSHPLEILYPLATPVTTTLAHATLPYVDGSAWVDAEVTPQIEATFRPVDFPDQPTIQSVDVQRVNADGTAWTVATGLTVGGSCIEPLPPLGVPVTYRATSSAASGSTASSDFLKKFGGRSWVLNFGNAAQEFIEFSFSPETSNSLTHGGTGYHFADGGAGNGLPVFYPTTDRDISGTWKFNALGAAKSHQLKALLMKYPTAWLRDPFGERFRAHVNPSESHGSSNTWAISMDWEAERFREAWDG